MIRLRLQRKKWTVQLSDLTGAQHSLGRYDDEEEAARVYDAAVHRLGLSEVRPLNLKDGQLVPKPVSLS